MRLALCLFGVLAGCANDDGVRYHHPTDSDAMDTKLYELSDAETEALCRDLARMYPAHDLTCDGYTTTVGIDAADCVGAVTIDCDLTVGQLGDCAEALYNQACSEDWPSACTPFDRCQ